MISGFIRTLGLKEVQVKAAKADGEIRALNRAMIWGLLDYIKPIVANETPEGPGHFGYHLRDSFRGEVRSSGLKSFGELKSPSTGYWREFGTRAHFNKPGGVHLTGKETRLVIQNHRGNPGERAFMTAHKTLSAARRLINAYYGGLAAWWKA